MESADDSTTHESFIDSLLTRAEELGGMEARLFAAQFDPDPQMPVFMRSFSYSWDSLARALAAHESRGLLVRIPLFWQCEPLVYGACRASGTFFFLNEEANMPVGRVALRDAGLDTVLTTARDASRFAQHLAEAHMPAPRWILIHRITDTIIPSALEPLGRHVYQEVHLVPGIPLLMQCAELMHAAEPVFHLADGYTMDADQTISGTTHDATPLSRYRTPRALMPCGTCSCARASFRYGT